ncbi:MAG: sensor histidine kinase [Gemmatimonadota bacterium]
MSQGDAPPFPDPPRASRRRPVVAADAVPAVPADVTGGGEDKRAATSGLTEPLIRALARAAAEVVSNWRQADHSAVSATDLRSSLTIITDAVAALMRMQPRSPAPHPDLSGIPPFVPARRLVEQLRRGLLRQPEGVEGNLDHVSLLSLVRALEQVQDALDLDAAHRFTSRLSGQDAQQLVVEMAHDMRSPLGSILILAERLRSGPDGLMPPQQQRQLGLIYSAAFGLSSLAGDVIELARGGTSLMDQQPLPFAVSDVLQSIADILRPMAEEKRLDLTWKGPTADLRIGHASALNRVLLNLATNAIKFTNAGSVRISCREHDRLKVEFSVTDTGRGIPAHVLTHLFEAFRQRQMPGDYAFSSAGLGLSICQKLVRAMSSELKVETELERGTRFHFTLELPQPERL